MNSNCAHSVSLDDDGVTENPSFLKFSSTVPSILEQ